MTLADKLTGLNTPKFPVYSSPIDWSTYNLNDLVSHKFYSYRNIKTNENIQLYVGDNSLSDEELDKYIEGTFEGIYFNDNNQNKSYEEEIDHKIGDIRLFISKDGAYLLEQYDKTTVDDEQIAIFLEVPDNDLISGKQLLIKVGKNASKYANQVLKSNFISGKYSLQEEEVKALLQSLGNTNVFLETFYSTLINTAIGPSGVLALNWLTTNGIDVFSEIADFFGNNIRLDEKRWNKSHPDYSLRFIENDVIPFFENQQRIINSSITKFYGLPESIQKLVEAPLELTYNFLDFVKYLEDIENSWAFLCGLWNGLVDLISDIFSLIVFTLKGLKSTSDYLKKFSYHNNLLLEYIDNFIAAIQEIDWLKVQREGFKEYLKFTLYLFTVLPEKAWEIATNTNQTEVSYYSGYAIFQVLETILPPLKIAKLSRTSKIEPIVKFIDEVLGVVNTVKVESRYITEQFFKYIKVAIDQLKIGDEALIDIIKELFDSIKQWIDDLITIGKKKVDNFQRNLTPKIAKFLRKFPELEKTVLDNSLVCHFNGELFLVIKPKDLITNLKIFTEVKDKEYFTNIKKANIFIEDLNQIVKEDLKIRKRIDKYTKEENIEFFVDFKDKIKRKAEISNAVYVKSKGSPPYKLKTYTVDRYLKEGDVFHVVEFKNQTRPGNFASIKKVNSLREARLKLAIKKAWKNPDEGEIVLRTYKVKKDQKIPVRDGFIGRVKEDTPGSEFYNKYLEGGYQQYEFLTKWDYDDVNWADYLEMISEDTLK